MLLKVSRKELQKYGLLVCECGWPENNHFSFGKRKCANTNSCSGYKEVPRIGSLIKSKNKLKRKIKP